MRLLLDTHALLWWALDSKRLSPRARMEIGDYGNEVLVSAATAWEIAIKFKIGRLPEAGPFVYSLRNSVREMGFAELPISIEHAQRAGLLAADHKDPFDRMLIAQADTEGLSLISNERVFDAFSLHRIW